MRFEWDGAKRVSNLRKHGLDFRDIEELFDGPFAFELDPDEHGEDRWLVTGTTRGRIAVAVVTEPEPEVVRVISLRPATPEERDAYAAELDARFGRGPGG